MPVSAQPSAGVNGVRSVVARANEQEYGGSLSAIEQANGFGSDRVGGTLHKVAVVVGCLDVGLFRFANLGCGVDKLHCCLLSGGGWTGVPRGAAGGTCG